MHPILFDEILISQKSSQRKIKSKKKPHKQIECGKAEIYFRKKAKAKFVYHNSKVKSQKQKLRRFFSDLILREK
jgi:hypothetical protein